VCHSAHFSLIPCGFTFNDFSLQAFKLICCVFMGLSGTSFRSFVHEDTVNLFRRTATEAAAGPNKPTRYPSADELTDLSTSKGEPEMIPHEMTTVAFEIPGFRVSHSLGLVRGVVVRSRSVFGTIGASLQTLVGGDITLFTQLCEKTRKDAFERMLQHASEEGADAVIGVRYDATEVMDGVTEVLCYGTAVRLEKV
jgi:uncharacterized protein YbjQ (UPF0145 family)